VSGAAERREIDLHRSVCVVKQDRIEVQPARSAAIAPLIGLLLGILAAATAIVWLEALPFWLALVLLGSAIVLVPFSGMGFIYSVYGANVVIDREKQSAVWQQGMLGMGVGTEKVVPFSRIERLEIDETNLEEETGDPDFAQYEVALLKTGGKRLIIGQVTAPRYAAAEGLARAREVGEAIAALVDKPLQVNVDEPQKRRRRRRRRRSAKTTA
jgi:hypothetical protein